MKGTFPAVHSLSTAVLSSGGCHKTTDGSDEEGRRGSDEEESDEDRRCHVYGGAASLEDLQVYCREGSANTRASPAGIIN